MSDLSAEARALLEAARDGDDPTPQDRSRIARALAASLGIAVLAPGSAQATSVAVASATALTVFKTVVVVAAFVAVGAGAVWSRRLPVGVPPTSAAVSRVVPTVRAAEAPPVRVVATEPSLPSPVAVVVAPPLLPTRAAHVPARTIDTLRAASELLGEAHRAMNSGANEQALAILTTYRERFPHGVLSEERDVQRVLVLCRLGRREEAQAAAAGFLRAHPRSPLVSRVERACAPTPVR